MIRAQRLDQFETDETSLWDALGDGNGQQARTRLFEAYAGFAAAIAWRFYRRRSYGDLDPVELRQLAHVGLLEAIDRFDAGKGVPFKAFAAYRITGALRDGVLHMSEMREQLAWRQRLRRERMGSLQAGQSDVRSSADALAALAEIAIGLALGFMLEDTGMLSAEDEGAGSAPGGYESAEWRQLSERLQGELEMLGERERHVLRYHYLEGLSFGQIARLLGLSNARISQLHKAALGTLQRRLAASGHFRLEKA